MKTMTANALALSGMLLAGILPAMACGGEGKPAESPPAGNPSAAPAAANAPAASGSTAADAASAAPAPSDSAQPPMALAMDSGAAQKLLEATTAAPPAKLKPNGVSGGDALAKGVRDAAKKAAPGMQPEGPLATGSLKEKQRVQADITLKPGKCYTIVGYSLKLKDLDLHLLLPPGILRGQDTTDDTTPVIFSAPDPMCPETGAPVTYKLDIFADSGNGDAAVQLYSK